MNAGQFRERNSKQRESNSGDFMTKSEYSVSRSSQPHAIKSAKPDSTKRGNIEGIIPPRMNSMTPRRTVKEVCVLNVEIKERKQESSPARSVAIRKSIPVMREISDGKGAEKEDPLAAGGRAAHPREWIGSSSPRHFFSETRFFTITFSAKLPKVSI